ncbi:MAG: 2-oxoacid:acceptor oxidoreductase family protein [Thermoflexus sp.]|jgi:pyruvate ferredoxin oxidoreductase gamma subunit|nr:2-oxoacid:acceptor oxidoreductase family protein [Thermoflexus sp.]
MGEMIEIRRPGRGGQGVAAAAQLLAEAAMEAGYFVQALPDDGPERSAGALDPHGEELLRRCGEIA